MSKQLLVEVPFSGFYESSHSSEMDDYFQRELEYLEGECGATEEEIEQLSELSYFNTDWKKAHEMYAKEYVENLEALIKGESKLDIKLTFESMTSPKEYNFATDRIFAYISDDDVVTMYKSVERTKLEEQIRAEFTAYDGFIPFYSNDLNDWNPDPTTWDHNELGILLKVFLAKILDTDDLREHLNAWKLMESSLCNGFLDTVFGKCVSKEYWDLVNTIHKRQEEKETL